MIALADLPTVTPQSKQSTAPDGCARSTGDQVAQAIVTAILYAVPALVCAHLACVSDPDIWWHLRSGEWIVQHRGLPHTDPFSSFGNGKPWAAYSWLFEVVVLQLFERFGLAGIVVYSTGMVLATTVALHHLIKRLQADFSVGILLTFIACLSMGRLYTPRPWHLTILFFVLELDILMHARRTGRLRELLWLPAIFAVWANVHIQFVNGLLVLGLACAEAVAAEFWAPARTRLKFAGMLAMVLVFFASLLATLANPYGWGIYKVAHDLAAQPGVIDSISELQSIPFRGLADYCVLALAVGSVIVLARGRQAKPFETALLALALVLSFRSRRDVWMMAAAASAIIASGITSARSSAASRETIRNTRTSFTFALVPAITIVILIAVFRFMHIDSARLATQLAAELPVNAVQAVRNAGYEGPLFNDYGWGGYLMWGLHQPVSIDGRAALHGTERLDRFNATWSAGPDWRSDQELAAAGVIVGPVKAPLVQVLRLDPRYRLAYEDKVAAVFIPRTPATSAVDKPRQNTLTLAGLR